MVEGESTTEHLMIDDEHSARFRASEIEKKGVSYLKLYNKKKSAESTGLFASQFSQWILIYHSCGVGV